MDCSKNATDSKVARGRVLLTASGEPDSGASRCATTRTRAWVVQAGAQAIMMKACRKSGICIRKNVPPRRRWPHYTAPTAAAAPPPSAAAAAASAAPGNDPYATCGPRRPAGDHIGTGPTSGCLMSNQRCSQVPDACGSGPRDPVKCLIQAGSRPALRPSRSPPALHLP